MNKLLLVFLILWIGQSTELALAQANSTSIDTINLESQLNSKIEEFKKDILEAKIEVLEKTNNALEQQWTPISALMAVAGLLFTLVTIAWAFIFAFGFVAYKSAQKHKNLLIKEYREIINAGRKGIKLLEEETEKLSKETRGEKQNLKSRVDELARLQEQAKKFLQNLEDKTLNTVSGFNTSFISNPWVISATSGTTSLSSSVAKICTKCGNLYADISGSLEQQYTITSSTPSTFSNDENLCKKCREESKK